MKHKLCYCAHQFNKPLPLPPRNKCLERSSIEHSYYVTCAWNDIIDCIDAFLARGENIFCWRMKLQCLHSKTSKFSPMWVKVYVACLLERFSRLLIVVGNGVYWQRTKKKFQMWRIPIHRITKSSDRYRTARSFALKTHKFDRPTAPV